MHEAYELLDTKAIVTLAYSVKNLLNLFRPVSIMHVQFVNWQVKFIEGYLTIAFVPNVFSFIKVWLFILTQSLLSVRSLEKVGLIICLTVLHKPIDMNVHLRSLNSVEFRTYIKAKRVKVLSHFFRVDHCRDKISLLTVRLRLVCLEHFHRRHVYFPHVPLPSVLLKFMHNLFVLVDVDL